MTEVSSDLVHWIFAFKYWTVAIKLEKIKLGENPDLNNRFYKAIFVFGFVLNLAAGIVTCLSGFASVAGETRRRCDIATAVFLLPLFLSCVFLWDAFRRFKKTKDQTQTINNKQIGILSLAFVSFALGFLAQTISLIFRDFTVSFCIYELTIISFFTSTVLLSSVLYKLIIQ